MYFDLSIDLGLSNDLYWFFQTIKNTVYSAMNQTKHINKCKVVAAEICMHDVYIIAALNSYAEWNKPKCKYFSYGKFIFIQVA